MIGKKTLKVAIFGSFDGILAGIGIVASLATTVSALNILRGGVGIAIAELFGMGIGEWLSDSDNDLSQAIVMGAVSGMAVLIPTLPFLITHGVIAHILSYGVCGLVACFIAWARGNRWKDYITTIGVLIFSVIATMILTHII